MISIFPKVSLKKNVCHTYLVYLPDMIKGLEKFWKILSIHEKLFAEKFIDPLSKNRYIISHGILRKLLSLYLKSSPEHIIYNFTLFGKPSIKNASLKLEFNMSHSKNYIIYAFILENLIGVDIEWKNKKGGLKKVADYILSENEKKNYKKLKNKDKISMFYKSWTYKESILKATGYGLSYPFNSINIINQKGYFKPFYLLSGQIFYFYTPYILKNYENTISCSHILDNIISFRLHLKDFV